MYTTKSNMPDNNDLVFFVNGKKVVDGNIDPEMTLLTYLRKKLRLTGSKLGCAEGGCGACTVMVSKFDYVLKELSHFSVNACLAPVCAMYGLAVTTVEGIGSTKTRLHPVQERIAKAHGSQCGFCTPGIVMSMYTLLRNDPKPSYENLTSAFEGNLCRCTGYRPILEGYRTFTKGHVWCQVTFTVPDSIIHAIWSVGGTSDRKKSTVSSYLMTFISKEYCCGGGGSNGCCRNDSSVVQEEVLSTELFNPGDFMPFDPSQEPIFPPELMNTDKYQGRTVRFCNERVKWIKPATLDELLDLKSQYPNAKLVNGNTELGVEVKFKNQYYPVYLMPSCVPEMKRIEVKTDGVTFGAAVSLTKIDQVLKEEIERLPEYKTQMFSAIVEMLRWFAGHQIRNVSAVGGNIMTASPISDLNPLFVAAACKLTLASKCGTRQVSMNEHFFTGYRKTVVEAEEILLSVHIPHTREHEYFYGYKQSLRREDDIAIVNSGMRVCFESGTDIISELSISYGGMAPTTIMAKKTMKALIGRKWESCLIDDVCELLHQDLHLSPSAPGGMIEYRKTLAASFFFKFYLNVLDRLNAQEVVDVAVPSSFKSSFSTFQKHSIASSQLYQEVSPGQPVDDAVGRPLVHLSAYKQATGQAVYCDDVTPIEGELYLALVTSSKAHAIIRSVKIEEAMALKGVYEFVTYTDVPGQNLIKDEEMFASDKVVHVGQVIGAIVAEDQTIAQRAAKLVSVQYDELEPIITIEEAIAKESFYRPIKSIKKGNTEEAFEQSDQIIEGEIRMGGQEHFYLETNATIAIPKGEDSEMEIMASTQNPTMTQTMVAQALGVPANRIVCKVKRMGGGFGGKETRSCPLSTVVAVAANKVGRPVRIMLDRDEDMCISGTRHPMMARYKVGYTRTGHIKALEVDCYSNAGCSLDLSLSVMERTLFHIDNSYRLPNVIVTGYVCKTNTPSNTAFRGFGGPQAVFFAEHWMTDIATRCGITQQQVREVNLYKEGELTHFNQPLNWNNSLQRCWTECLRKSDFPSRRRQVDIFNSENRWKKRGIAITPVKFGISFTFKTLNQAGALVHIYGDGSVLIAHGGTEMGQGLHTKMIQVASRALSIPSSQIFISETSTNTVPNTSPTAASASSDLNGEAIKNACQTLLERLEPYMLAEPKGSWKEWIHSAYMDRVSLSSTGFYKTPDLDYDWQTNSGNVFNYFTVGVGASEVEIDCLTGDHRVLQTDIVMDLGESLNPAIDIGQIEGAFMQGYGMLTMEDHHWSPNGVLLTRGPGTYKIPGFGDVPTVFNVSLLSNCPNKRAIYSSKAVGEPPLMLANSVFFAIKDAISSARSDAGITGIFRLDSPATSEAIRMACQDQFTEKFPPAEQGTFTPWFVRI